MKKLLNVTKEQASKSNLPVSDFFKMMIEMHYQFINLGSIQNKYQKYKNLFNEWLEIFINEVLEAPFTDVLGKLMAELDVLENSTKSKFCQHLTPDEVAYSEIEMVQPPLRLIIKISGICNDKDVERDFINVCDQFKLSTKTQAVKQSASVFSSKQEELVNRISFLNETLEARKTPKVGEITVGSGVNILADMKYRFNKDSEYRVGYQLNDLDEFICKVCIVQIETCAKYLINGQYPIEYIVTNHEGITEYKYFKNGVVDYIDEFGSHIKTKVVGCTNRDLITVDAVVSRLEYLRIEEAMELLKFRFTEPAQKAA
ncbi:TPA: hypothetical protein NJ356_000588 [Vibrio parahaemolyticus]|nr:hypothetical protein [Vibrio parahaemolyticus]